MKIKYLTIIVLLVLLFTSCKDYLEREPKYALNTELALSTFDGLVLATNGAYAPLYAVPWYGRNFVVNGDLLGGNLKGSPMNSGRFREWYAFEINPSTASFLWGPAYFAISRANNVLEYADKLEDPTVDDEELDHIKGECYFIRALAYFDLVRTYGQPYTHNPQSPGVPIVLKTELTFPARNTVAEVYTQINSDLDNAIELMGTSTRAIGNSTRATADRHTANALKAKVALYMEDWQTAADYSNRVISSTLFFMYTPSNYIGVWGINEASEIIFEVCGTTTSEYKINDYYNEIGNIVSPDGYGDLCATEQLLSTFEPNDIRRDLYVQSPEYPGYSWPAKYPGKDGNISVNNIPVLRLSEMYLIRAEATLNGATGYDALNDYNVIRTNRGLTASETVTLQDIYDERRKELCFEGNQKWDLTRTGRSLDRDEAENSTITAANIDIPFPDNRWVMAIPINQLDVNPNLEQNPY